MYFYGIFGRKMEKYYMEYLGDYLIFLFCLNFYESLRSVLLKLV